MTLTQEKIVALQAAACLARAHAYAPYSHFLVGAAILDRFGHIHCGCNIENASYGLTICAERVALGNAVASGEREFDAIAIAAAPTASPCGACRQVLAEFAPSMTVYLINAEDQSQIIETTVEALLPQRFVLTDQNSGDARRHE